MRYLLILILLLCAGCSQAEAPATAVPTLGAILSGTPTTDSAKLPSLPTPVHLNTPVPSVSSTTSATTTGDHTAQYRQWMEEARRLYPYKESVDTMWAVMMCESSGNPTIQGPGELTGLFQYQPSTWDQAWNPYRDQPITDARAQIFATAKAWSDGNQSWWSVCIP